MNTIKCCCCGKELSVGDKIYKDEKGLDYYCSLECMLDFYTTYTEQTIDEEFFDYCDDYCDNENYDYEDKEDECGWFDDLNFTQVMTSQSEREIKNIIKEFNIISKDLNENYLTFEVYKSDNEWILDILERDKKIFNERITFVMETIKRKYGF